MRLAKKILSLFLALALCLLASGCSASTAEKTKKKKVVVIKKKPTTSQEEPTAPDEEPDAPGGDFTVDVGDGSYTVTPEEPYQSARPLAEKQTVTAEALPSEYTAKAASFAVTDAYTVIYPNGNLQLKNAAQKLVDYFAAGGVKVGLASDATAAKSTEILVGDTNRKKSTLPENKYAVTVSGQKLLFESGNFNGAVKAVSWFVSLPYQKGQVHTLTGAYDFSATMQRADGTYRFVWGDEFDGNALDATKWELTSSISAGSSFKLSRDPDVLRVSDGLLKLSAARCFDPDNNQIQAAVPYTIEGKRHMNYQFGYLEMKARIPFGGGAWPSLWLSGACKDGAVVSSRFANGDVTPANFSAEMDIIEYTSLQTNLHKWFYDDAQGIGDVTGIDNKHSSLGAVVDRLPRSDLELDPENSNRYQIIGFEWTPNDMTVYINGEKHYTYNWKTGNQLDGLHDMTDFLNPVFIRINNHLLPNNIPSDYSTLPCEYFVDYVRLYQKTDVGGIWLTE